MAKQHIVQLVDDLDGKVLESGEGTTIQFALEGRSYEIDLSEANAGKLRDALAPFIKAAQPVSAVARSERSAARRGASKSADLSAVREWAKKNGHEVSARGRIGKSVMDAFQAAKSK